MSKNYFERNKKIYEFDGHTPSGAEWVKLSVKSGKEAYRAQAVRTLAELIPAKGGQARKLGRYIRMLKHAGRDY